MNDKRENPALEGEIAGVESPAAQRKRRRFWGFWIAANVLLTFVVVPAIFMLVGDAIVQTAEGSESARVQTGIGLYFIVAAGTLCTLLPINVFAAIFGLVAAAGRRAEAERLANPDAGSGFGSSHMDRGPRRS